MPGVVILLAGLLLPDSPASYAERGMLDKAKAVRAPDCMHLLHVISSNKKCAPDTAIFCDRPLASEWLQPHIFGLLAGWLVSYAVMSDCTKIIMCRGSAACICVMTMSSSATADACLTDAF